MWLFREVVASRAARGAAESTRCAGGVPKIGAHSAVRRGAGFTEHRENSDSDVPAFLMVIWIDHGILIWSREVE